MNIKEHRIYKYMDEPVRVVGLTMDELGLSFAGLLGFIVADHLLVRTGFFLGAILLVAALKRFKKMSTGFSLKSYLHWHFGLRAGVPNEWPKSWIRRWLP
jgi:type IV conjugative transfer system protein TraL